MSLSPREVPVGTLRVRVSLADAATDEPSPEHTLAIHIKPVDQQPHTPHIEQAIISYLQRALIDGKYHAESERGDMPGEHRLTVNGYQHGLDIRPSQLLNSVESMLSILGTNTRVEENNVHRGIIRSEGHLRGKHAHHHERTPEAQIEDQALIGPDTHEELLNLAEGILIGGEEPVISLRAHQHRPDEISILFPAHLDHGLQQQVVDYIRSNPGYSGITFSAQTTTQLDDGTTLCTLKGTPPESCADDRLFEHVRALLEAGAAIRFDNHEGLHAELYMKGRQQAGIPGHDAQENSAASASLWEGVPPVDDQGIDLIAYYASGDSKSPTSLRRAAKQWMEDLVDPHKTSDPVLQRYLHRLQLDGPAQKETREQIAENAVQVMTRLYSDYRRFSSEPSPPASLSQGIEDSIRPYVEPDVHYTNEQPFDGAFNRHRLALKLAWFLHEETKGKHIESRQP